MLGPGIAQEGLRRGGSSWTGNRLWVGRGVLARLATGEQALLYPLASRQPSWCHAPCPAHTLNRTEQRGPPIRPLGDGAARRPYYARAQASRAT